MDNLIMLPPSQLSHMIGSLSSFFFESLSEIIWDDLTEVSATITKIPKSYRGWNQIWLVMRRGRPRKGRYKGATARKAAKAMNPKREDFSQLIDKSAQLKLSV